MCQFSFVESFRSGKLLPWITLACVPLLATFDAAPALAGGHREAPGILRTPQVDATDLYLFRSYEIGRGNYVVMIADYNPYQVPSGGPNLYPLDPNAYYDFHVLNNGDAIEDITFRFRFYRLSFFEALEVGDPGATQSVPIATLNIAPSGIGLGLGGLNEHRLYSVQLIRGAVDNPDSVEDLINVSIGGIYFGIPPDYIGERSLQGYEDLARLWITDVGIPGCNDGRVFVGQRQDPFRGNLAEVFDLINTDIAGPPAGKPSDTAGMNVTSIALEVPIDCLTLSNEQPVVGVWTAARLPRRPDILAQPSYNQSDARSGDFVQVSRLGAPLVNHLIIGLPAKDLFNRSHPKDDQPFLLYVGFPTLPELIEQNTIYTAPNIFPRPDLLQLFTLGQPGLTTGAAEGEMLRLNTSIPPTPPAAQSSLGLFGGDLAGLFNGRRPGDDVFDILIRGMMGIGFCDPVAGTCPPFAPDGLVPFTDGVDNNALLYDDTFPFLNPPLPGSPK